MCLGFSTRSTEVSFLLVVTVYYSSFGRDTTYSENRKGIVYKNVNGF